MARYEVGRRDTGERFTHTTNHRNGYSKKTVLTENEALELSIPRDRSCSAIGSRSIVNDPAQHTNFLTVYCAALSALQ